MRHRPSGSFELPIPASAAIELFTPEGERRWVPGWDPRYPDGLVSDDPGTVFVTGAEATPTTWVIIGIEREDFRARYARLTPGQHAGTVAVQLLQLEADRCRVSVSYDMTLVGGAAADRLDAYDPGCFAVTMAEWSTLIHAHLA